MLFGIGPVAQLEGHGIPIVHDSPHVGQKKTIHNHFAVNLAFRLHDSQQGFALGNAAWGRTWR